MNYLTPFTAKPDPNEKKFIEIVYSDDNEDSEGN